VGGLIWAIIIVVLVGCVIYSFVIRRHGESDRPGADWQQTDELFNDPSTNRVMRVWLDQKGERHYVPEGKTRGTS
jgi:hypothetical protein